MVLLVGVFAFAAARLSDRLPISNGLGWDGAYYGRLAADPAATVREGRVDAYGVQRIVPSLVVHLALRGVGAAPTARHIVTAFEVLNALLLTIGALLWVAIARALQLAPRFAWLGWLGLFVNFACMRQPSYDPVLTDVTAFVIGLAMLLCFLRRRRVALAALTLIGGFTWPVAMMIGLLLLVVPPIPLPERSETGWLATLVAVGAGLATGVLVAYVYFVKGLEWQPSLHAAIIPSMALATAFVVVVTLTLLHGVRLEDLWTIGRAVSGQAIALAVVIVVATRIIQRMLVHDPNGAYFRAMLRSLGMLAVAKPFNFYVPHVVYFGAIVGLMLVAWPTVTRVARSWGIGVIGVMLITIGLGLNSESRQAMLGFPFLVAVTVVAVSRGPWPASGNWLVAATGLVASKIWMPMPLVDGPTTDATVAQYPMQWYFLSHGPWMSVSNFALQSVAVVLLTLALWVVRRGARAGPQTPHSATPVPTPEMAR